jgi:hypothetical protein
LQITAVKSLIKFTTGCSTFSHNIGTSTCDIGEIESKPKDGQILKAYILDGETREP